MTRSLARLGTIAFLASLLGIAGCDDGPGITGFDAGAPPPGSDGGPIAVPMDGAPAEDASLLSDAGASLSENFDLDGCSDGLDNDDNGLADCADTTCNETPVCCLGSVTATCCTGTPETVSLSLGSCEDGPLLDCTVDPRVAPFGTSSPVIEARALVPQGMPAYAGVTLGDAVDLRGSRLSLSATVRVPASRCRDCVDATGIALVAPADFTGALNYLRLAVLVIGATDQVALVVNGEVVDWRELDGDATADETLTIWLRTGDDGVLTYSLGDADIRTLPDLRVPTALTPTLLGQNENRAGMGAISVTGATRELTACDVPGAISTRATPVFPAEVSDYEPALRLGRASMAERADGTRWAVVEVAGSLHALQANGNGDFIPTDGADDPGVTVVASTGSLSYSAPWLEATEGGFQLYYVETDNGGGTRLLRSFFTALREGDGASPVEVLDAGTLGVERIGAATHLDDANLLIVELENEDGTRLERFSPDGVDGAWTPVGMVAWPAPGDVFAFDRDSVGEPAVVRHNGLLRLYYSGQRGTRRSIGLLVSDRGTAWRSMGEVLAPGGQGFDSLQVSAPAPLVSANELSLYYLGRSGADRRIGLARALGTIGE